MIAIAGVGSQEVVHRSSWFVRFPVVRVDSTVAWLIGFPGDQLVRTRSGSLSFGGMWMVLLSWHVARLGLGWHYTGPGLLPRKTILAGLPDLP